MFSAYLESQFDVILYFYLCMKQRTLTAHTQIRKGKILVKLVAPGYSTSQGIRPSRQLTSEPSTSPTAQTTAR